MSFSDHVKELLVARLTLEINLLSTETLLSIMDNDVGFSKIAHENNCVCLSIVSPVGAANFGDLGYLELYNIYKSCNCKYRFSYLCELCSRLNIFVV